MIARNEQRLQQRGPPWLAMRPSAAEVIALASFHGFADSGVAPVTRLPKMPVPTPAPHAPHSPQQPPFTTAARRRASASSAFRSEVGSSRAEQYAAISTAGTRK